MKQLRAAQYERNLPREMNIDKITFLKKNLLMKRTSVSPYQNYKSSAWFCIENILWRSGRMFICQKCSTRSGILVSQGCTLHMQAGRDRKSPVLTWTLHKNIIRPYIAGSRTSFFPFKRSVSPLMRMSRL